MRESLNTLGTEELARYCAWGIPVETGEIRVEQKPGTLPLSGETQAHAWELHTLAIHLPAITVYMSFTQGRWVPGMGCSEVLAAQLRAICESYTQAHPEAFLAAARARRGERVERLAGAATPSEHEELTRARLALAVVELEREQERVLAEQLVAAGAVSEPEELVRVVGATLGVSRGVAG